MWLINGVSRDSVAMVIAIKNSVSIACHTKHTEGDFVAGWLPVYF